MIYGAEYAVDVFFWMSGFLMTYLFVGQLARKKTMSYFDWFMVYFHRFYRILPPYMFTLFFIWSYNKYMGYGPQWIYGDAISGLNACKDYWWTNMLFLNNFIPDGDGS